MHPETMAKLNILPRAPCWLTNIDTSGSSTITDAQCVTVWPCIEVFASYLLLIFSCSCKINVQFFRNSYTKPMFS